MSNILLITRIIYLLVSNSIELINSAIALLEVRSGIKQLHYNATKKSLSITYDQRLQHYSALKEWLISQGIESKTGLILSDEN